MKKLVAMMLALAMVLAMTAALADDANITGYDPAGNPPTSSVVNGGTFTITKNYDVTGNENAVNPADTLQFTVDNAAFENDGVETVPNPVPAPTIENVTVAQGAGSATITVQLPNYTVPGIYTYQLHETDTNVAGVTYLSDALYLKVTVINDPTIDPFDGTLMIAGIAVRKGAPTGDKIAEFENKYDAGTLYIDKTVKGNMGDTEKVWNFTVTLKAPDGDTVNAPITIASTSDYTSFKEGTTDVPDTGIAAGWTGTKTLALQLTHNQNIKLENIPAGVTYTVTETESGEDDYVTTGEVETAATIASNDDAEVNIVNEKNTDIDTGITLESVPYIMIMMIAMAGAAMMIARKRREEV